MDKILNSLASLNSGLMPRTCTALIRHELMDEYGRISRKNLDIIKREIVLGEFTRRRGIGEVMLRELQEVLEIEWPKNKLGLSTRAIGVLKENDGIDPKTGMVREEIVRNLVLFGLAGSWKRCGMKTLRELAKAFGISTITQEKCPHCDGKGFRRIDLTVALPAREAQRQAKLRDARLSRL